jgi:molybdopterin synthase sulfur carrier subunit
MRVRLYATFREKAGGSPEVEISLPRGGSTVREVLGRLAQEFPELGNVLWNRDRLHPMVIAMVNGRDIHHLGGLKVQVTEEDTLLLFPPLAGG